MLNQSSTALILASVKCSKHCGVPNEQESLSDYVRRVANEKNLSHREIARRSGDLISHVTVGDIINNNRGDVKVETIKGLAKGLGVSEEEIFAVVRGKTTSGELTFDELRMLELYRKLSPEKRIEAIAHLEVAFQFQSGGHEQRGSSTLTGSSKRSEKKRA